jgi:ParB-like chromosome segregation protein Spo0J
VTVTTAVFTGKTRRASRSTAHNRLLEIELVMGNSHNELVAGFHRIAAARSLGLAEVPVVIRDAVTEDADRAVENIASYRRRHDVIMPTASSCRCPS